MPDSIKSNLYPSIEILKRKEGLLKWGIVSNLLIGNRVLPINLWEALSKTLPPKLFSTKNIRIANEGIWGLDNPSAPLEEAF